MKIKPIKKMKLYGFNNLTKTLSFNLYDICYAKTLEHRQEYLEYIDNVYNADRLTKILTDVSSIIGAHILNIAKQDYEPQGASVTMLIAESEVVTNNPIDISTEDESPGPISKDEIDYRGANEEQDDEEQDDEEQVDENEDQELEASKESVVGHLDKSHITVHTYPESHPDKGISTIRADIDVSTCGEISPLKALNYLITNFEPDIAYIDYRVRGFTRDVSGKKLFIDHKINSIQNYMSEETREQYQMMDVNIYQENIFHTKMLLKEFDLDNYLFGDGKKGMMPGEKKKVKQRIKKEMLEIFYGRNISKV